ncbi:MAG: class II aldolase/adducin family protein [Candidatus Hydrogenedentota bacterium]
MNTQEMKAIIFSTISALAEARLLKHAWGSVSALDRNAGVLVIKPTRMSYDRLSANNLVAVDFTTGEPLEGEGKPSSDLPTHMLLYKRWDEVNAIVHTHAACATSWAQACVAIPCLGITHAEYFYGEVPVVRPLTARELKKDYEHNLGRAIVEYFAEFGLRPLETPAALVPRHGAYAWGKHCEDALCHTHVLEDVARLALQTVQINPRVEPLPRELMDKHFLTPREALGPRKRQH